MDSTIEARHPLLAADTERAGFPPQIRYIVGNEACERFSFYGMRAILVVFMTQYLFMAESSAKGVFHTFVGANYFLTLFGGYLADRYLGKYHTIFWLSLLYCAGHAVLATGESQNNLYVGLALIAIGAGGIKPCVSALVGDQFTARNRSLIEKVFELFYWSVNFGSFFSTLLIPQLLHVYGPRIAFGTPGLLMGLATLIFWMGRKRYVLVPPTGAENSPRFVAVVLYSLLHLRQRKPGQSFVEVATEKFGRERVEGAKAALSVLVVFFSVAAFWALFDQHSSTWVLQAQRMDRHFFGMELQASQLPALNPIMVLALIPFFSFVIYPGVARLGIRVTPLRKMSTGMVLAGVSFLLAGFLQHLLDSGHQVSVGWQFFQYLILTASEVMVSITGLEFAYTQAPRSMKSTIMSIWLVTVAIGNWLTAIISYLNSFHGAAEFYFYAGVMFIVSLLFVVLAARYKERSYLEGAPAAA